MKKNKLNTIKSAGFKVPNDYFDNLEEHLLITAKLHDENISAGFDIPEGYFDTLEERIVQKVPEAQASKVISLFRNKYVLYTAGIAASIVLLFNISIFDHQASWEDIDAKTAENYVINENIGTYEIASLLDLEDIDETNFLELDMKDEQLETYLENNAEIETLLIE